MAIILISYADNNMAYSLQRIGKQAKRLGLFDEIILYTPANLPDYILQSPLMQYHRGGGYWAWKPAIIWETLQKYEDGTKVIYVDAGCSLFPSDDWTEYFNHLREFDTVCFEYKDNMKDWQQFGETSTRIKFWTKMDTINYFNTVLGDDNYSEKFNKIWGGFLLCKGKKNHFIKHWLTITLKHPDLIIDPTENLQDKNLDLCFHKHDQSIITPLAHLYKNSVKILVEKSETEKKTAVLATRVRAKNFKAYFKLIFKDRIRNVFGERTYNKLKKRLKTIFN